jgi:lipid-binding SYLF domain-containing protein
MKIGKVISLATVAMLLVGVWASAALAKNEVRTVKDAAAVMQKIQKIPEKGIPPMLLKNAKAVAIFPGVIKGAFMVGGERGRGVILVKEESGRWSNPVFLSITAGSIGWQIGGTSTDLVLVFKDLRGVQELMAGKINKVTLGADASVAAGPVGRSAEAGTDVMLKSGILSYSRTKGLFAGASLQGAALLVDNDSDAAYYGKEVTPAEIVSGTGVKMNPATKRLQQTLMRYSQ